jgi:lipopolysaccharide heptosyltransferase II
MSEPEGILLIKLCCIGDVLKTTPVLKALRERFPDARIGYLISPWAKDAILTNPHLDEIILFNAPFERNPLKVFLETLSKLRKLRKYEWAFVFHRSPKAAILARVAGIREIVGFVDKGDNRFLTVPVKFQHDNHEIERYVHLARAMGVEVKDKVPRIYLNDSLRDRARDLLKEAGLDGKPFVAIHPGGGKNPGKFMPIKRWFPDRFADLASTLTKDHGVNVLWVGGREDHDVVYEIEKKLSVKTYSLVGKTTFLELAAVLEKSSLFLGGDSGPLHIAAAVGTKTVGIYGPSDPKLIAPPNANHWVVREDLPCSPCYVSESAHKDFSRCPIGTHECMKKITLKDVLETLLGALNEREEQVKEKAVREEA